MTSHDLSLPPTAFSRRTLTRKAFGLGAAALVVGAVGPVRRSSAQDVTAEKHTSQPYTVTEDLNLRSGPGKTYPVILVMPKGSNVTLNAQLQNGFLSVNYEGTIGWAHQDWVVPADGAPADPVIIGTSTSVTAVNLRSGPSTGHQILRLMAEGSQVQASDTVKDGFRYVIFQGLAGWAFDAYLTPGVPVEDAYDSTYAMTTAPLNLRAEASVTARVLLVIPSGTRVRLLDGFANGYRKVSYTGAVGWAAVAYLN